MVSKTILTSSFLIIISITNIKCERDIHRKSNHRVRRFLFPSNSLLSIKTDLKMPMSLPGRMSGSFDVSMPITIPLTRFFNDGMGRSDERLQIFSFLESLIERFGMNGKSCLLRIICELSEIPMNEEGIVGSFINALFKISNLSRIRGIEDYIKAENLGKNGGNCSKTYAKCPFSFFNTIYF